MKKVTDGDAIIYAESVFDKTDGKTAHGLIRYTSRYNILSVVDSKLAGKDAGMVLDGNHRGIPIYKDVSEAIYQATSKGDIPKYMVIGIAPDGGRLDNQSRADIKKAIMYRLNIDSGLHDFLTDIPELRELATKFKVELRDVRKTAPRDELHMFEGKITKVNCPKIAVLGTDSAIGKRTTTLLLHNTCLKAGIKSVFVGTGQTSWMQGAKYYLMLDSLVNDFVGGEVENTIFEAWKNENPAVIFIEGQGSLLNPGYCGGFEILTAGRPDYIILQHAPMRKDYDGFPGYPIDPLEKQIKVIELISGKKVIAITINHENLDPNEIELICDQINKETNLPVIDPLTDDLQLLVEIVKGYLP